MKIIFFRLYTWVLQVHLVNLKRVSVILLNTALHKEHTSGLIIISYNKKNYITTFSSSNMWLRSDLIRNMDNVRHYKIKNNIKLKYVYTGILIRANR